MFRWLQRDAKFPSPYSRKPIRFVDNIPIFKDPDKYIANYDRIAEDHLQSLRDQGTNPFIQEDLWQELEKSTVELVRSASAKGSKILDAGVGLGRLLSNFPDYERYGVDVALPYLRETRSKGINVAVAQLEDLPYEDASFDVVVSTDVLEHVFDLYGATIELCRVLKTGGHLIVRVPFEEDMQVYYESRQYEFVHVRRFDRYGLRLHFERILGLTFVEEKLCRPLYRGATLMRGKPFDNGAELQAVIESLPVGTPAAAEMIQFAKVDQGMVVNFMNHLASFHPDDFKRVGEAMGNYLEINMTFKKTAA